MSFSMRLPTPLQGVNMDMITSGKVGVGRSGPDQRDVTGQNATVAQLKL